MPFAYYAKLSPGRQRIYRKSDAIVSLALPPGVATGAIVARVRDGLARDDRAAVQRACQELADALTAGYRLFAAQEAACSPMRRNALHGPDQTRAPVQCCAERLRR